MPESYSCEDESRAMELFVVNGLTLKQAAEAAKVPLNQVQKWSKAGNWVNRRKEYRQALSETRLNIVLLRNKLVLRALETLDPKDVQALTRLETVLAKSCKLPDRPKGKGAKQQKGLSDEAVKSIRRDILGVEENHGSGA